MTQIYADTYYTSTADTLSYYLTDSTNIIFSGKAYKYPDGADLKVNINNICSSHLDCEIPASVWSLNTGNTTLPNAVKTFHLYNSANTELASYQFINDWSYGTYSADLGHPINNKCATGMFCFKGSVSNGNVVINHKKNSGNGYTVSGCGEYAIYYSNLYGGYDSFLIEGKVVESKDMEHYGYAHSINNNNIAREKNRYQTNINLKWAVSTSWLTDEQSKVLYDNLLTSNNIYLHNLITNKIYPVHITDTTATKKEFQNERKLISYTLNLESDNLLTRK